MSIPKIIHYCWFGHNSKSRYVERCIESWKKYCPGYQVIEWNEENFDIDSCPQYVREAYEAKKWAFVSDYARLKIIYDHGGIYVDTDVKFRKSFDPLLQYDAFFGFEDELFVATGLGFGAVKGCGLLREMLIDYQEISFIRADGTYDLTSCPVRNIHVFLSQGLQQNGKTQLLDNNVAVFSPEYFCPLDVKTGFLRVTKNTYSIHAYQASWYDSKKGQKKWQRKNRIAYYKRIPFILMRKILGESLYVKIRGKIKGELL